MILSKNKQWCHVTGNAYRQGDALFKQYKHLHILWLGHHMQYYIAKQPDKYGVPTESLYQVGLSEVRATSKATIRIPIQKDIGLFELLDILSTKHT